MRNILFSIFLMVCVVVTASCQDQSGTQIKDSQDLKSTNKKILPDARFTGKYLDGKDFDSFNFEGQKILLGFFSYRHKDSVSMLTALQKLKPYEQEYNFRILLVSIDTGKKDAVQKFLKANKIDLPTILEDANLSLAEKFKIENEVSFLGLSSKHEAAFGFKSYGFAKMEDGESVFIDYVKENLSIKSYHGMVPRLGIYPKAPDFKAKTLNGQSINLSDYRGKAVLVIFFSPKCPHCQQEMFYLRDDLYPKFKDKGFEILAFSALPLKGETLKLYNSFKFKWPVVDDSKREVRNQFSQVRSVPENYLIDTKGHVKAFYAGYSTKKHDIFTMQIKSILGLPNPPLVSDKHFNGVENCKICHEEQYVSWSVTPHAQAWETLEIKGEQNNPECVGCHSVGFNDPKGYKPRKHPKTGEEIAIVPQDYVDVQCENCHGIGGPHVTEVNMMERTRLEKTCRECHTAKFSLHFDFDERIKKVNHSDAKQIMKLSENERVDLLKKVAKKPDELFDTKINYVGSQKCQTCHEDIYAKWQKSFHGHAFETLKKAGKDKSPMCLQCHTVGYGEDSGYTAHVGDKDFEDVGCESCHGPGEKHIKSKLKTDIRGLGDDCPFCVIEQICYSCHDLENSPGFNIHKGLKKVRDAHGYK